MHIDQITLQIIGKTWFSVPFDDPLESEIEKNQNMGPQTQIIPSQLVTQFQI